VIKRVFIDTDIILDVALEREPFYKFSKSVFALAENSLISGYVTSNEIANLYYILRKQGGDLQAREFIRKIMQFILVIPVNHQNILDAMDSGFKDFEDGIQNYSALENQCEYIITRNIRDYKHSSLRVELPEHFIKLFF